MTFEKYTHKIASAEIAALKLLGYRMEGLHAEEDRFINNNFPNCDLHRLLIQVNNLLNPLSDRHKRKGVIFESSIPPSLRLYYLADDFEDVNTGLAIARTFTWETGALVAKHDFFRLPRVHRGRGIAKQIFKDFLQQYINMGVKKICVYAALEDGGFIWAKNFFAAEIKEEVAEILNKAKAKLTQHQYLAIHKIYDNYYMKYPGGNAFPIHKWAELPFMESILRGSTWHGSIDLTNREQFAKFVLYVLGEKS
ncbi:hypothetical protein [Chitinophaga sp. sic0106]|uniref:hypothetical protein n=1 Tax=Chitinophaga sp. sic0106 TaxID=2854785 RepID=UPI001C44FE5C|nr:hypothetical protein [Chitinophaga sp. sic0106]MBV7533131.1 hypothetical protein [Chitinophaga sp. sic0106]